MSFIAKLFFPSPPPMPQIVLPEPKEVPSYDDEERKKEAAEDEKRRARKRKGRSSTILTTSKGLNEISDEEYEQKSLIGG